MDAELGADLIAVGVVDLIEDPQSPAPCLTGRGGIAGAEVDVAKAVKCVGLVETVAVPEEVNGPFVAGDGLPEVTAMVMDVAEAVPDGTLPARFLHPPHHGQGPFAIGDGLVVVAEQGMRVADGLEGQRLPGLMISYPVQVMAPLSMTEHLHGALLPLRYPQQGLVDMRLAGVVVEGFEQPQSLLEEGLALGDA